MSMQPQQTQEQEAPWQQKPNSETRNRKKNLSNLKVFTIFLYNNFRLSNEAMQNFTPALGNFSALHGL